MLPEQPKSLVAKSLGTKKIEVAPAGHPCWRTDGMRLHSFTGNLKQVRSEARVVVGMSSRREQVVDPLLRCQVFELLANAVRHGNKNNPKKCVRVWGCFGNKNIRLVVEDEGEGFFDASDWNRFYRRRQSVFADESADPWSRFLVASYPSPSPRGTKKFDLDRGNGLCMAIPYWNGGFFAHPFEAKVCVVRREQPES